MWFVVYCLPTYLNICTEIYLKQFKNNKQDFRILYMHIYSKKLTELGIGQ